MPYCDNQGVGIHYQVAGTGPPLVLLHGFASSLHDWSDAGYVAALEDTYRLILVDARGHGDSDKPHEPDAYRAALRAGDVVAVLDDLGLDRAHIFGYSMGAVTGFALAAHAPDRCRSLILGGASPGGYDPPRTDPVVDLLRQGAKVWAEASGLHATPARRARMLRIDPAALIAHRAAAAAEHHGFMAELLCLTIPCLLFAGDAAPEHAGMALAARQMARTTFVSLSDATHAEGFSRADLVLPHVTQFLATVSQARQRGAQTA
jgi:pimeloyl-ACP methyl ester carboxylesterase